MRNAELIKFLVLRFLLLGGLTAAIVWLATPAPTARINVQWGPDVGERDRADLEQRFTLLDGELMEGATWQYSLRDQSRDNVRALVEHPSVSDTHHLDRTRFELVDPPPGAVRRVLPPALLAGVLGSLVLLGVRALRGRTVCTPEFTVTAILSAAPVLLLIATIVTLLLALVAGSE
jgi:hypothetical protein